MNTHELRLTSRPFCAIAEGRMTIETRLFDEKRKQIAVGDTIVFHNRDRAHETIEVRVVNLYRHKSFKDLFSSQPQEKFGGGSIDQLLNQVYAFYSQADEARYGVLGIEISKVEQQR